MRELFIVFFRYRRKFIRRRKFILDVIPIVQLWDLGNKSAIDISDQKLKKVLSKLKIEQQLVNKIEGEE